MRQSQRQTARGLLQIAQRHAHFRLLAGPPALCYTDAMIEAMNRAARFFDADYAGYLDDLPLLEAYAQRTGSPLLELGCGTGRLLIPLAEAGYRVTGVDLSPEMLRIARAKAEAAGVAESVTLIEGDFADAPLDGDLPPGVRRDEQLPAPGHTGTPTGRAASLARTPGAGRAAGDRRVPPRRESARGLRWPAGMGQDLDTTPKRARR